MKMQVGHYEADDGDVYLPIGFKPSLFLLASMVTNPVLYLWWGQQYTDMASQSKEGIILVGGSASALNADDAGIQSYDSASQKPTITEWSSGATVVARTATTPGTYYRATATGVDDNGLIVDRSAIFECVASTTTASTEPVWPSQIGDVGPSDNGVYWEKVDDVALRRVGYQGVLVADDLNSNGEEMFYAAWLCDEVDLGDVDGWTGGIKGT